MEALDSALFALPALVDFRVILGRELVIEARTLEQVPEADFRAAVSVLYPGLPLPVRCEKALPSHRPLSLGKRYAIRDI